MTEPLAIVAGHDGLKAEPIAVIENYEDIRAALRKARELRGMSNADCENLAGLTDGHVDKLLGPSSIKNFGPVSFDALVGALAVKFVMVVDEDREAILAKRWKDRQRKIAHVRMPSRISKALLERAKPELLKQFGEKLALALGDDAAALLLGMKPARLDEDERGVATTDIPGGPQETTEPVAAVDPPYAAFAPVSPPAPPAVSRAHLRVVQSKSRGAHARGSKYA